MKRISVYTTVFAFIFVAVFFPVNPISDFWWYWTSSIDLSQYIKGGALVFLYAPFSFFKIPPYFSALIINLSSFLLLSSIYPNSKLASISLFFIGMSWAAWSPIVNSDIPSASLLAVGSILLVRHRFIVAFLLLTLGLSMRLQSVIVALFILICIFVASFHFQFSKKSVFVLFLSILMALGIDHGLKTNSIQKVEIINSQRVPLYAGLHMGNDIKTCGEITSLTDQEIFENNKKTLIQYIANYLEKEFPFEFSNLILCKFKKIVMYSGSGSYWLGWIRKDNYLDLINFIENFSVFFIKFMLAILLIINRRTQSIFIPVIILLGYLGLHILFEIQPRYIIPALTVSITFLIQQKYYCKNSSSFTP